MARASTDWDELAQWFYEHQGTLLHYAMHFVDRQTAEDLVQDAIEKALRSYRRHKVRDDARMSWAMRVVRNACLSQIRSNKSRTLREDRYFRDSTNASPNIDWEGAVADSPNAILQACLSELSELERAAFVLSEREGNTQAVIARHLGVSQPQVSRLISRAREHLRNSDALKETWYV